MKKEANTKVKKPIYKKWWFWLIIVLVIASIFGSNDHKSENNSSQQAQDNQESLGTQESETNENLEFDVMPVRNDVTGKWKIATTSDDINIKDIAVEYYNTYFESDDEVHAIVNFSYMTTSKISVMGNMINVTNYKYVDKEEHDAKILFSGDLIDEYHIDLETGKIEKIQ